MTTEAKEVQVNTAADLVGQAKPVPTTAVATQPQQAALPDGTEAGWDTAGGFALAQRLAMMLSKSSLVPPTYQGNLSNCLIAMNMAKRIGADPLMVIQNLHVVQGKPGWSGTFLIACFNKCGRFSAMRFEEVGVPGKPGWKTRAWAVEKETNEKVFGAWITWEMVEAEGWSKKSGSKWLTMPQQMGYYRAAAFLVRAYAPEIAMGLQTTEEIRDIVDVEAVAPSRQTLPWRGAEVAADTIDSPEPADTGIALGEKATTHETSAPGVGTSDSTALNAELTRLTGEDSAAGAAAARALLKAGRDLKKKREDMTAVELAGVLLLVQQAYDKAVTS